MGFIVITCLLTQALLGWKKDNALIHLSSADLFLQFKMGGGNDQTLDHLVTRDSENIYEQTILKA